MQHPTKTSHSQMINIRRRTENDLEGCVACIQRVYAQDRYPVQGVSNAKAFINGSAVQQAWIAESEGIIKGHVAASIAMESDVSVALWWQKHPDDKIAVLGRLFVDPDSRGSGIAGRLIAQATAWANEKGIRLVLFALEKDRAAARVYQRLGWTQFGTQIYHYCDDQQMDALCFVSPAST
ncbi:uncharacterized protein RCC_01981 [Ramularia collo-cygni]|uniref:N-acetyltransferase domain-containing protein n=1 Tax=Ramularia collo-cygni TaxID=112498 RepID=A0A2D3UTI6_9PEZI|nr:uncharacterized protein RCC_01981 [Ramularia collo-cygni]CZT16140.1 uncharacterized protein RCC_01981 [Ramularia collo-cygni]